MHLSNHKCTALYIYFQNTLKASFMEEKKKGKRKKNEKSNDE